MNRCVIKGYMMRVVLSVILSVIILIFGGCGDKSSGSDSSTAELVGVSAKGPFVKGSKVTVYQLNADGTRSQRDTSGEVIDNQGNYTLKKIDWNGMSEIEISGKYLNENNGKIEGPVSLSAVFPAAYGKYATINVNILTHLMAVRTKALMSQGVDSYSASSQARGEVNKRFDMNVDPRMLDITDGNGKYAQENADLLRLSAAMANNPTLIDSLSEAIKDDGIISGIDKTEYAILSSLDEAVRAVDFDECKKQLSSDNLLDAPKDWSPKSDLVDLSYVRKYSIGGVVDGLDGRLVIHNSNGSELTLNNSGSFTFDEKMVTGDNYSISIIEEPSDQSCRVTNGSGVVAKNNITNINIECKERAYRLGGTLNGVNGEVTLGLKIYPGYGSDFTEVESLSISENGTYVFNENENLTPGTYYQVTIKRQPIGQTCSVNHRSALTDNWVSIGNADVSDITINCRTNRYSIGGTVSGSRGNVQLDYKQNHLLVSGSSSFEFKNTTIEYGSEYNITMSLQPEGQVCSLFNANGIAYGKVDSIRVECREIPLSIGGMVTGLIGELDLDLNVSGVETQSLRISKNGNYLFNQNNNFIYGKSYRVAIKTQPEGQLCVIAGNNGMFGTSNVNDINVLCASKTYNIHIDGSGVEGVDVSVKLKNNTNGEIVDAAHILGFTRKVRYGSNYNVTIESHSPWLNCTLSNASGAIDRDEDVTVTLECTQKAYKVGGSVTHLNGTLGLNLYKYSAIANSFEETESIEVSENGNYTFDKTYTNREQYRVAITKQPDGQECYYTLGGGMDGNISGWIDSSDGYIGISCATDRHWLTGSVSGISNLSPTNAGFVVLQNNNSDDLNVYSGRSEFSFGKKEYDTDYNITILSQPDWQNCSLKNAVGKVIADVHDIVLECSDKIYKIGGLVSGLNGDFDLQLNVKLPEYTQILNVAQNGTYVFEDDGNITAGKYYSIDIKRQPSGQTCKFLVGDSVYDRYGQRTIGLSDKLDIDLNCTNNFYKIGLTPFSDYWKELSTGDEIILQNNGNGERISITSTTNLADGHIWFPTQMEYGSEYNITLVSQPEDLSCSLNNVNGTVQGKVEDITLSCTSNVYTIGGNIEGLNGELDLKLWTNSQDGQHTQFLNRTVNGDFTFAKDNTFVKGTTYQVMVENQPDREICRFGDEYKQDIFGEINASNIIDISVKCRSLYGIGGSVTGLDAGDTITLSNTNGDMLGINNNGDFNFDDLMINGSHYDIAIAYQSNSRACIINNGLGIVSDGNITNIMVNCNPSYNYIGGTVSGLSGELTLQNNDKDDLNVMANGTYTFSIPLAEGSTYGVTILKDSDGQICSVVNAEGTINNVNITDANITCITPSSTAQLGILTSAAVNIYEIENDGNRTLLYTGVTTGGDLSSGGQFEAHISELEDDKIYLYTITGGVDIDANDDGILDVTPIDNNGTIHLFSKGSDLKAQKSFRVTMASDIVYKKFKLALSKNPYSIASNEIQNAIKKVIAEDIDGDGVVNISDLLLFNPVADALKLTSTYHRRQSEIVSDIHKDDRFYYFGGVRIISSLGISVNRYDHVVFSQDSKMAYVTGYDNNTRKFYIIDINDSQNMFIKSSLVMDAYDVAISPDGNTAYIAADNDGLQIVDVSNADTPVVSNNNTLGLTRLKAIDISLDGGTIYVGSTDTKDISAIDTATMTIKSSVNLPYGYLLRDFALSNDGKRLFVASYNTYVLDVTDETKLALIFTYAHSGFSAYSLAVSPNDTTIYVAGESSLHILNVPSANNGGITMLNTFTPWSGNTFGIAVSNDGSTAYVTNASRGFFTLDVRDASSYKIIGSSISQGLNGTLAFSPDGSLLYGLLGNFKAIDVGDIDNNPVIARYSNKRIDEVKLSSDNTKAYLATHSLMTIIDISTDENLSSSSVLGSISVDGNYANDIALNKSETRLFLATDYRLQIIDITNSKEPTLINTIDTNGSVKAVTISADEKLAYIADYREGIKIIDISDENNLTIIGSVDTAGSVYDIALSPDENTLYAAARESGLQVIDISNKAVPIVLKTYKGSSFYAKALALSKDGNKLFIGGGGTSIPNGLEIVDVSTPSSPSQIKIVSTHDTCEIVLSSDEKRLYIADGGYTTTGNMKAIDISNLDDAHVIGAFVDTKFDHAGVGIALSNDGKKAYLADSNSGLFVIDVSE